MKITGCSYSSASVHSEASEHQTTWGSRFADNAQFITCLQIEYPDCVISAQTYQLSLASNRNSMNALPRRAIDASSLVRAKIPEQQPIWLSPRAHNQEFTVE